MSPRLRDQDLGWFDEEDAERDEAPPSSDLVQRMEWLAENGNESTQFRALEWLANNKHKVAESEVPEGELLMTQLITEMSDAELNKALAGYFNPGWVEMPEDVIEREVETRVRKRLRMWAKQQDVRQATAELEAVPVPQALDPDSEESNERRALAQAAIRREAARQAAQRANGART